MTLSRSLPAVFALLIGTCSTVQAANPPEGLIFYRDGKEVDKITVEETPASSAPAAAAPAPLAPSAPAPAAPATETQPAVTDPTQWGIPEDTGAGGTSSASPGETPSAAAPGEAPADGTKNDGDESPAAQPAAETARPFDYVSLAVYGGGTVIVLGGGIFAILVKRRHRRIVAAPAAEQPPLAAPPNAQNPQQKSERLEKALEAMKEEKTEN